LVVEAWWAQDDPIHHRKPAVPFKHHAEHRHHIPKPRYRVTNWPEYDAALRRRGSLTVWITDEAIAAWRAEPRTTPGGQPSTGCGFPALPGWASTNDQAKTRDCRVDTMLV
jgi:hypothetical protein